MTASFPPAFWKTSVNHFPLHGKKQELTQTIHGLLPPRLSVLAAPAPLRGEIIGGWLILPESGSGMPSIRY